MTKPLRSCGQKVAVWVVAAAFCVQMALAADADSQPSDKAGSMIHAENLVSFGRKLMTNSGCPEPQPCYCPDSPMTSSTPPSSYAPSPSTTGPPIICECHVSYSGMWNTTYGPTTSLVVLLKNLGQGSIPTGCSFTVSNPSYTWSSGAWNLMNLTFAEGTATGLFMWGATGLAPMDTATLGMMVSSSDSSGSFLPTECMVMGTSCEVIMPAACSAPSPPSPPPPSPPPSPPPPSPPPPSSMPTSTSDYPPSSTYPSSTTPSTYYDSSSPPPPDSASSPSSPPYSPSTTPTSSTDYPPASTYPSSTTPSSYYDSPSPPPPDSTSPPSSPPYSPSTTPTYSDGNPSPPSSSGYSCLTESQCRGDALCNNCLQQNNAVYWQTGIVQVCTSCHCSSIDANIMPSCYNCLSWARPSNTDGAYCTECALLYNEPMLGGPASAQQCYDCVVNMDGVCTQARSCADPPTMTSSGAAYSTSLQEIAVCWDCMAKHRFYIWGTEKCGDPIPLGGYTLNPLPM